MFSCSFCNFCNFYFENCKRIWGYFLMKNDKISILYPYIWMFAIPAIFFYVTHTSRYMFLRNLNIVFYI
jgi:hypothetical protein